VMGTVMGTVMVTMTILTTVTMTVVPLTWTLKWTLVSLKIVYPGREGMLLIGTTSLSQKRLDGICPGYRQMLIRFCSIKTVLTSIST
jgi:hypothetical protein